MADGQGTFWRFNAEAGTRLRDEAIANVEIRSAAWRAVAYDALRLAARTRRYLTSDHVWAILDGWDIPRPDEPRAIGPVMIRGVAQGLVELTTSHVLSTQAQQHRRPLRMYRSLVCDG